MTASLSQLNKLELNQKCRQALEQEKVPISPDSLHCLQLMIWGLPQIVAEDGRLIETINEMIGWKPHNVMKYLTVIDGQEQEPVDWAQVKTPQDLATQLILTVHDHLTLTLPDYPYHMNRIALPRA